MIKNFSLIVLLLLTLIFNLTQPIFAADPSESKNQVELTVNGMTCGACVENLKKTFAENPDIDNIDVNLETKKVTVNLKKAVDLKTLEDLVSKAGYSVEK